jgi:predicted nuclease of predicted toxin-antitoxin system
MLGLQNQILLLRTLPLTLILSIINMLLEHHRPKYFVSVGNISNENLKKLIQESLQKCTAFFKEA